MTELKVVRDHDEMYLHEDRKDNPKEYFKFILSVAREHILKLEKPKVLDIGCATGDFLYYLNKQCPNAELTGFDVMPKLLARANREVRGVKFSQADVCDKSTLGEDKYNFIFMNGVHSIFDSLSPWLDNMLYLAEVNNSRVYLFGLINEEDVDVLVKVRYSHVEEDEPWQSGWNYFSKSTIENFLKKRNINNYLFHNFDINIDLPYNTNDPLRTWTFTYKNGDKGIINGAMLLHQLKLLEIEL